MGVWLFCEKWFLLQLLYGNFSLVYFTQSGNILRILTELVWKLDEVSLGVLGVEELGIVGLSMVDIQLRGMINLKWKAEARYSEFS